MLSAICVCKCRSCRCLRGVGGPKSSMFSAICFCEWRPSRCLQGVMAQNTVCRNLHASGDAVTWSVLEILRGVGVKTQHVLCQLRLRVATLSRGASLKFCAEVTTVIVSTACRRAGTSTFRAEVTTLKAFPASLAPNAVGFAPFAFASGDPFGVCRCSQTCHHAECSMCLSLRAGRRGAKLCMFCALCLCE